MFPDSGSRAYGAPSRYAEVRRIVYDDGDRQPRWLRLMAGLEALGVRVDDAALGALPLELDDLVVARYGE